MLMQQGDVLIELVDAVPFDAKKVKVVGGSYVLAEGETTGHRHVLVADQVNLATKTELIEMYEKNGTLYLKVKSRSTAKHEEHKPVTLEPGTYRVRKVREYDHFAEEAREVRD